MRVLQILLMVLFSAVIGFAQNSNERLAGKQNGVYSLLDKNKIEPSRGGNLNFKNTGLGFVEGLATDEDGAAIPNLMISFADKDGKIVQTKSDEKGEYKIKLSPGVYKLSARIIVNSVLLKIKETEIELKDTDEKKQNLILYCADKEKCPKVTTYFCG